MSKPQQDTIALNHPERVSERRRPTARAALEPLTQEMINEFLDKLKTFAIHRPQAIRAIDTLETSFKNARAMLNKKEITMLGYIALCEQSLGEQQTVLSQPHTFGEKLYVMITGAVQNLINFFRHCYDYASGTEHRTRRTTFFDAETPLSKAVTLFKANLELMDAFGVEAEEWMPFQTQPTPMT